MQSIEHMTLVINIIFWTIDILGGLIGISHDTSSKANNLLKDKDPQTPGDDVREGLAAVISIKHSDPKFESQTKVKLLSPEVESIVGSLAYEGLMFYFQGNTPAAQRIVGVSSPLTSWQR